MKKSLLGFLLIAFLFPLNAFVDVIINELYYNPPDDNLEDGVFREFVELYNPSQYNINLTGYQFDNGILFSFPEGTIIKPYSYLLVVKNTSSRYWSNSSLQIVGPYEGNLANTGERITLKRADGTVVETFKYKDTPPWPRGADGYESSLERISSDLPADDYHSWRSSAQLGGTPGAANSVITIPAYPVIRDYTITPAHPTSSDDVQVRVTLDGSSLVNSAVLRYETLDQSSSVKTLVKSSSEWQYWKGTAAPSADLEWTTLAFDDSSWLTGQGGFGYGDLDRVNTVLSDMQNQYTTIYIRTKFTLATPDAIKNLALYTYFDDGFVCYINGVEVARDYAPQPFTYASIADGSHEGDIQYTYSISDQSMLKSGENVIALVGFNISLAGSSDFVLIPSLVADQSSISDSFIPMTVVNRTEEEITLDATIPKTASQNLVRSNIKVDLTDGQTVVLPHEVEPIPFLSYFVYDREIESTLPILWLITAKKSGLIQSTRAISGVVSQRLGEEYPTVYDGANLLASASNRVKVKFIKGSEYDGDRTINIIPEVPTGGTNAGISSPFREQLGYWLFRELGVLAEWGDFYRIITLPESNGTPHTQQLIFEQVNEQFMVKNGLNPDGDLYKLVYSYPNWEKHTNKADGTGSIEELLNAVQVSNMTKRREEMEARLDIEEMIAYSATSMFVSNWDGYWNNNWMYLDPDTQRWKMIPWDLDWIWGATPPPNTGEMYWKMPLSFTLNGVAVGNTNVSRGPAPFTEALHAEPIFYQQFIDKLSYEMERGFAQEKLFSKMDELENTLLADLELIQQQTGRSVAQRIEQITESYDTLKLYVERRRTYLKSLLPVSVEDWSIF